MKYFLDNLKEKIDKKILVHLLIQTPFKYLSRLCKMHKRNFKIEKKN